ncbi:MAG: hypothetical protein ACLFWB_10280, partial [Armatimonadota bacterium]
QTEYPDVEGVEELQQPDVSTRRGHRRDFHRRLRRKLAKRIEDEKLDPLVGVNRPPEGMKQGPDLPPTHFRGRPKISREEAEELRDDHQSPDKAEKDTPIKHGDSLASRARRLKKKRRKNTDD